MNIKKITVISVIVLTVLSLTAVKLIFPIKTEISGIKRFYDINDLAKTKPPDNTSFEDMLDKHLDIQFDLVHTKDLFTESLKGTITIENEQYLIFTRDNDDSAAFGGGSGSPDNSIMYIGNDLSHFMLLISEKIDAELSGIWLNCTDYEDYKSAVTEFYTIFTA